MHFEKHLRKIFLLFPIFIMVSFPSSYSMESCFIKEQDLPLLKPLQDLVERTIHERSLEQAFQETFGLICREVVERDRYEAREMLTQCTTAVGEVTGSLKAALNQQIFTRRNEIYSQWSSFPSTDQIMLDQEHQDADDVFLHHVKVLERQQAFLGSQISTLIDTLDDNIFTGKTPQCFKDAQSLQRAIKRKTLWRQNMRTIGYTAIGGVGCLLFCLIIDALKSV